MKVTVFSVLRNRTFTKLFLANVASQLGTTIGMVAFTLYLLDRFGEQPIFATVTQLMNSLPTLLVFFLVGVLADRLDRQKIALYANWIRFGITLLLLGSIQIGWMPLTFALLFLRSGVARFFQPAEAGLVQGILQKEEYTQSAGLNQMVGSIFALFGVGLGTASYWFLGMEGSLAIDAAGFLVSALLIRSCRFADEVRLPNGNATLRGIQLRSIFADLNEGMKYMFRDRLIIALVSGFFLFGVINGFFSVLPLFLLKYKLAPETYELVGVWRGIVFGVGILLGSMLASALANKMKLYHMLIAGLLAGGICITAIGWAEDVPMFLFFEGLFSITLPFINVSIGGWMPQIIDPKMMGRVQGWVDPLMMLATSLTLGFISFSFPAWVSIESLYMLVGGCILFVGVFYWAVLPRLIVKHEQPRVTSNLPLY